MRAETALAFVLAAVAVIVLVRWLGERSGLPAAALLTVVGIGYAVLPGPNISLDPEVVLTLVLPPLLYNAALGSSLVAIRRNLRTVISLSVALVLVTALLIGVGFDLFVTGATLAVGTALGAAVAPTDPVAALAVARKVGLPRNLITLMQGEGLLNDATALTTLTVAVAAAKGGGFSIPSTAGQFLVAAAGGLGVGVLVAVGLRVLRHWTQDILTSNAISLATPFLTYLLADVVHVSGVLAVVICGLIVGHDSPRSQTGASRLQTGAVWRLVNFLLEGFVFLLIGQQFPAIVDGLNQYDTSTIIVAVTITLTVVLLARPLWLLLTQSLPRSLHTRLGGPDAAGDDSVETVAGRPRGRGGPNAERLSGREVVVLSWAGTRGVVSLAAILTVPLVTDTGAPFPDRDLLLFCTLVVVLVTLVGQGLTFAPLVSALGLHANVTDAARLRNEARSAAVQAALATLQEMKQQSRDDIEKQAIDNLSEQLSTRLERYQHRLDLLEGSESTELPVSPAYQAALEVRRAAIDTEREELVRWRDAGNLPDEGLRVLQRELDHEESQLPVRLKPPRSPRKRK
jgi:monovalent cation/hydrogen antiporter